MVTHAGDDAIAFGASCHCSSSMQATHSCRAGAARLGGTSCPRWHLAFGWRVTDTTSLLASRQKQLQPRELYYTELTDSETDAARRKEFNHVRQQWYEFVGADSSHDLEIDKVVALHNPALEQQFMEAFFDIQRRLQSADNDFVLLRDHDSSKAALQAFIERRLNDSLLCAIGSDQANLMLAWRGDLDHAHFAKAFYGFARLPELTAEQAQELRVGKPSQDYGWFGRGNYFTQYPSYGRAYSLKRARDSRRSSATIRRDDIGTDTDTDDDVHAALPLMLSFILMGRTYPVTEPCSLPFDQNLVGKPCVPGYDSHYALVSGPSSVMLPISSPTERPTADEIVVFNPCQILPRYIVYSSRRSLVPAPTGRNTVLWVAAASMPAELQQWIAMHNLAEVREFQSRRQLEAWMRRYSQVLAPLVPHRIRIITQSVLDDATNERGGEILIQHFKSSAEWSRIPIALACSPIGVRAIASRTCLSPPHAHSVAHAVDNDTYRRCFTATSPRTECTWRRVPPSHVTLHRSKTWAPSPSAQRLRYVDVTWGYCSCGPHALTESCVAPSNTFASTIRTCGAHRIHRRQRRHGAREPIVWLNLAFSPGAYVLVAALECSERVWLTIVVQYHCACCCRAMCSDCCAVWPLIDATIRLCARTPMLALALSLPFAAPPRRLTFTNSLCHSMPARVVSRPGALAAGSVACCAKV